jgi:hypothetical protein
VVSWSVFKMPPYKVDVVLIVLISFRIITACVLNDCICAEQGLFCERTDTSTPSLTDYEMDMIEYVEMTDTQVGWIKEQCLDFHRLQHIYMLDGSPCPAQVCVPCK